WPVLREVARFWTSRVTPDPQHGYSLLHVNSVAESHTDISNDTFTNLVAARALQTATAAAHVLGETPDPRWARIAAGLYVPFAPAAGHHLPFDLTAVPHSEDFGGGPLALLFLPALDIGMSDAVRRADYDFAVRRTPSAPIADFSMAIAPHTIAAASIGSAEEAQRWLETNFSGGTLKAPFNVRTETAGNNTGYFITGSGGYLQSLIFGLTGLRLREAGLVSAYPPVLPPAWRSLTLRNVHLRGHTFDVRLARDAAGVVRLTRSEP
ncbi:MAG: glycoside hydrolase family 65 protein, partial [Gammaproteobacteria bacterium]|nr:glycoside hydrolase family 65 protein [Gammaproteobacteria bacterium]